MKKLLYLAVLACTLTGFVAQAAPGSFSSVLASAKTLTMQYGAGITPQEQSTAIKILCADGTVEVPKEIAAQLDYFKAQDNFQRHSGLNQDTINATEIVDGISTAECQTLFDYIQTRNVACIPDESLVTVFFAADYLDAPQKLLQALAQRCLDRCDINSQDHALLYDKIISYIKPVASAFPKVASKEAELIDRGVFNLSNQGITNLNGLVKYATPYVTTLNLSDNALIALDIEHILQCFPNLTKINARNNMLPNTADIKALKNKEGLSIQLQGNPIISSDIKKTKKLLRPTRWQKNRGSITSAINEYHAPAFFYITLTSYLLGNISYIISYITSYPIPYKVYVASCTISLTSLGVLFYSDQNSDTIIPNLNSFMPTKIMHDKKVSINDLD